MRPITMLSISLLFWGLIVMLILSVMPHNHWNQWEKAHGYPFGRMCDSIFTGYVNTCR